MDWSQLSEKEKNAINLSNKGRGTSPRSLAYAAIYYSELLNDLIQERNYKHVSKISFDEEGVSVELPDCTLHVNYSYLDECERRWRITQ